VGELPRIEEVHILLIAVPDEPVVGSTLHRNQSVGNPLHHRSSCFEQFLSVLHERRIDIVSSLEPTKLQRDGSTATLIR